MSIIKIDIINININTNIKNIEFSALHLETKIKTLKVKYWI